jgi:hypothetical protein
MSGYCDPFSGELLMCGTPTMDGCLAIKIRDALGQYYLADGYHEVCCKRMKQLAEERGKPELVEKIAKVEALLQQAVDILEPVEKR